MVDGVPSLAMGALLAAVHVLLGAIRFALLFGAAGAVSGWLRRPAVVRVVDGVTGAVLIAFGIRTALEAS